MNMNEVAKRYLIEIGTICKEAREDNGITQVYIAKRLNVSSQLISHFEHGRVNSIHVLMAYVGMGLIRLSELPTYAR